MYGLLARILNGLEPLRIKFEAHVKKAGNEAVKKVMPAQGAVNEAGKLEQLVSGLCSERFSPQDPKAYITALLEVHDKYEAVVKGPFRAELGFGASLDKVGPARANVS
jgi:cullin 1